MKTYEQRKAELNLTWEKGCVIIKNWKYCMRMKYAENLNTGEIFKADWDTFLIEKNIIDMLNPAA